MDASDPPSAELLRQFWSAGPDLYAVFDVDGSFTAVNDAWFTALGFEPGDLHGRKLSNLVHPDRRRQVELELTALRRQADEGRGGVGATFDAPLRTADGGYREMMCQVSSGRAGGAWNLVAQDVTERRRTEAALRASEQHLALAMESAPIGTVFSDLDGNWQRVNAAMCQLLGRDRDELRGRVVEAITHPDDLAASHQHLGTLLEGTGGSHSFEKRYLHADGHVVSTAVTTCVVRDADGEPLYIVGQIVDITERNRTEAQLRSAVSRLEHANDELEAANRSLEHFVTIASHDLRSPLATVHGLLATVQAHPSPAATATEFIGRAIKHTGALLETVDGLLSLARTRTAPLTLRPVDVAEILSDLAEEFRPELARVSARIEHGELAEVHADPVLLRVLLHNLVANAIKFVHPERLPTIHVAIEHQQEAWELSVTDNGWGFDPEDAEAIFELFGRTAEGRKHHGVGVGLATCRQIAEQHGGTMYARALPHGARFMITLPDPTSGPGNGHESLLWRS